MTHAVSRPTLALSLLLGLAAGRAAVSTAAEPDKSPRTLSVSPEDEDGPSQIRERVRLYLDRHGDRGAIDPERRRSAVAAEYARFREEQKGRRPMTIGGTQWVSLGPTNGAGRMTAIDFAPNQTGTAYAGSAGGGLWKTIDGGGSWTVLTDGLNDLAVGAVAVAPSDGNVIYLGTGEGGYAIDFIPGIGLLKSIDGGATWNVPSTVVATKFYRISVHPTNPQELVAATDRGAIRSTDGGNSWTTVISRSAYGDVPDLVRDAANPSTLYATTWCVSGNCTNRVSKVLKSTDGGATWSEKSSGLPAVAGSDPFQERLSIAISPSSSSTLYAARAIAPASGSTLSHIYKTTDGGSTWRELGLSTTQNRYMADQAWYNNVLVVSPGDPSILIAGGTTYLRSTDGGTTFSQAFSGVHVDCHDLKYQGSTLWVANDGGVWTTTDDGRTATAHNDGLVTRQFYALAIDSTNRNRILAGAQDNGTVQRPDSGGTAWRSVIGADGFECGILPGSPGIAFGTIQQGRVFRTKDAAAPAPAFQEVSPPYEQGETTPFLSILRVDPASPSTIYTGSYRVWRSRDAGTVWAPLPTTTTDGSSWTTSARVQAIALSKTDPLLLLVGRRDGTIFRSGDGGQTWVSGGGLPGSIVNNVEIDPRNSAIAYAALATTTGPSLFKSTNGGVSWAASATGLPLFAAQVVRVDPTDVTDLFVGTDVGVYRSTDSGATWTRFGTGLPSSSVHDLQILDDGSMLRAATHGRGVWELQVTPPGNQLPAAVITLPAGNVSVSPGATVTFAGTVSDPDPADSVTGTWTFSDTATAIPFTGPVAHTFNQSGLYPVSLAARDSHGAVVAASVLVTVAEPGDSCSTPVVIPGNGPFPYTVLASSDGATREASDGIPACVSSGSGTTASVWFEFTPSVGGTYEISTCGTSLDTVVVVYTGPRCGPYVAMGCNDDAPSGSACEATASLVTTALSAGQTVLVQVTGFGPGDAGRFPLTVRLTGSPGSPPRVTGVQASEGPPGGSIVLISGANFQPGAQVTFDGVPASEVIVLGPTSISARAPAHVAGPVDVAVTTDAGTGTLARGFLYTPYTATTCATSSTALCLNGGRFRAEAQWRVPTADQNGQAAAVPLTGDTGYFWFFSANNIELVLKVVDGRGFNGKFWVFYGALSNVEYQITVTDLLTGAVRVYTNPNGQLSSVADTAAF